jgi:iron(III) transport system ATP-binding protein
MADLHIEGLAKGFGTNPVLRGVDLAVPSGGLVAILGASGSGKTTLLRLLCGFERADAGTIRIGGELVSGPGLHLPPEKRHIGYVAQEGALFPHLSVADNIAFGLQGRQRRARHRVAELLELVGLSSAFMDSPPHQLSGGEQQRVALARALAPEPTLVLLDEPFSALDAALRVETRQAVGAALQATRATALVVTHDQSEALSMGRQVAVLRQGKLVQVASPEMLYRHPVDAELAQFVGEAVLIPGVSTGRTVTCSLGQLPLASGMPEGPVTVLIRPEQIRLTPNPEGNPSDEVGIRARVSEVEFYGHDASVKLHLSNDAGAATLAARVPGYMAPHPGEEVSLFVRGEVVAYPT